MDHLPIIPRHLWYWTRHVLLSASGAFAYAVTTRWHRPPAIAGMVAGIVVFVALYTALWSSRWFRYHVPTGGLYARALSYALRVRSLLGVDLMFLVLVSSATNVVPAGAKLPLFLAGLPVMPDVAAATATVETILTLGKVPAVRFVRTWVAGADAHERARNWLVGDIDSLLPSFLFTLAVGCALSVILLLLSFCCLAFLRFRARHLRRTESLVQPTPL